MILTDKEVKEIIMANHFDFDMARAIEAAVMAKFEVAGYQWLDTAHFRKNIPSYATEYEWTALYRKVD